MVIVGVEMFNDAEREGGEKSVLIVSKTLS